MKLTKNQIKQHHKAEELLLKDNLSFEEKIFVLENWNESAENINSFAGAFFTPMGLAQDFAYCCIPNQSKVVDLCAGIGRLSFYAHHFNKCNVTCIELNPDYVRVGKKILPEATWINQSITEINLDEKFDVAISNPPFGNIKTATNDKCNKYRGMIFNLSR